LAGNCLAPQHPWERTTERPAGGRSKLDVLAKLAIVERESDETAYWIELLVESGVVPSSQVNGLLKEANEILAMIVASIKTLRASDIPSKWKMRNDVDRNPKSKI
jgi:hypothetical protein